MLRRHERTLQRKNFNSVLLQPRWPTKQYNTIFWRENMRAHTTILMPQELPAGAVFNEVLGITKENLRPSKSKVYGKEP